MTWKAIGESVPGTSHIAADKGCDDAVRFIAEDGRLIACISDGAGSALYGAQAARYCADNMVSLLSALNICSETAVYQAVEETYDGLVKLASAHNCEINEWSCTLLGCYADGDMAIYFQVGDGAIVCREADGTYHHIWWPHNGEYQNVTAFVVDNPGLADLNVRTVIGCPEEIAMFTDGLQMLALNYEQQQPHQPFFTALFPSLRMADTVERQTMLSQRLAAYLDSQAINERTDDDKTLFLATRL